MSDADAELVEWLRGQIDIWEQSDAGIPECAQAYLQISAKGLSTARLLLAQSAEIARLREALDASYDGLNDWTATYAKEFCSDEMVAMAQRRISAGGGTLAYIAGIVEKIRRARAALETKG